VRFIGGFSNSDTDFAQGSGVYITTMSQVYLEDFSFAAQGGKLTTHTVDIIVPNSSAQIISGGSKLVNVKFGGTTQISSLTAAGINDSYINRSPYFISSQKHNQVAGDHRMYFKYGIVQTDTVIYNTASPSMRLTPSNATNKLESAPRHSSAAARIPVNNGGSVTISVYVRKSVVGDGAAYNGNQPRLILLKNTALGISADTVIDTAAAAAGTWEQLTGTTATVTDDGVLEFIVDCDGTAGWVNVDDWSA
jgi:hypothetical protein